MADGSGLALAQAVVFAGCIIWIAQNDIHELIRMITIVTVDLIILVIINDN
jgi:hypothetical protein